MPSTLAIIKTYYQGSDRQRALSFWSIGSWGGSGFASLFGGMIDTAIGWRWIYIISIIVAILAILLIKGTPETKANQTTNTKFDFVGLTLFVIMMLSINVVITQSAKLGLFSPTILALIAVFIISTIIFIRVEMKMHYPLIDFKLFNNKAYTSATVSNFMLNGVAGTLIVANTFVQQGLGFSTFQTGLLSITYLITVLLMIRVGEKVLQKLAQESRCYWTALNMVGILLISFTFLSSQMYVVVCVIGYLLYGLGLGFYATPSTDTAISNSPEDKVGVASGIYKMASSLGGAFGIALSGTLYGIGAMVNINFGAMLGLWLNILMAIISFTVILIGVPKQQSK